MRRNGVGSLLVVVALAVVSAGCAQAGDTVVVEAGSVAQAAQARLTRVDRAAETTAEVTSGRFETTASITMQGRSFDTTVRGEFDSAASAMRIVTEVADSSTEILVVDGSVYMRLPEAAMGLVGGDKPWITMDFSEYAGSGTQAYDPSAMLDVLRGVSGEVRTVGSEDVRGVATTHFQFDVVPAKAVDKIPQDRRPTIESEWADELNTPIPVDVWVDDQDRVLRVRLDRDMGGNSVSTTTEFFDFGEPVEIAAPPADQVSSFEDIMGSFPGADIFGDLTPD